MSVWERLFDAETLNKARTNVKIKNVERSRNEITAETYENYKITFPLKYNSPYKATCSCDKKSNCEHEAALRYYLDEHPELLKKTDELENIINNLSEDKLKGFLLNEIKRNTLLTSNLLKDFNDNKLVDSKKYKSNLTNILHLGEGPDFYLHHIYDFDRLESKLKQFMKTDLNKLLDEGEYELGCELLCKIADALDDELSINQESWYNLTEEFSKYAFPLIESIYLTKEEINELEMKTHKITKFL